MQLAVPNRYHPTLIVSMIIVVSLQLNPEHPITILNEKLQDWLIQVRL